MDRKLIKNLIDAFKASEQKKTTGYDTSATVRRIENGTAWVHIPGGVDETPVKLTINASVGDNVQVRVSGGRAFLVGNGSAPPTDDTTAIRATRTANKAQRTAEQASEEATEAWHYAGTAAQAAISAQTSADSAATAASNAWDHADEANTAAQEAKASAISANNSANNALVQLSIVEDVAGTLRWISEHGDFVLTDDTRVREGTVYFIYQNGDYIPIASPDPSKNPSTEGWYILDVSKSQSDYIMSHLAVTSAGLWVLPVDSLVPHPLKDSNNNLLVDSDDNQLVDWSKDEEHINTAVGYKVLLSGGGGNTGDFPVGLTIYNDEGEVVGHYGAYAQIGSDDGKHILIDTDSVDIKDGQNYVAKFGVETAIYSTNGTELAHFGYAPLNSEIYSPYYTLGSRASTTSVYSTTSTYNVGDLCVHDDKVYVCIEKISTAEAWNSSHWQLAIGGYSMAEGESTVSSGTGSHAEGYESKALQQASHAEGHSTLAAGMMSHAGGFSTIAQGRAQTVIGKYNSAQGDPDYVNNTDYAFIIGNGTSNTARSNAFTVNWNGDVEASEYYSASGMLNLGIYNAAGVLTSTGGKIQFSIPTGRVFKSGTTIYALICNIVARVGSTDSSGTSSGGYYCIRDSASGTSSVSVDSTVDSYIYNAYGDRVKITPSMWTLSIQGGTNILVTIDANTNDFFTGSATIRGYTNNQPVVVSLSSIIVYMT